MKKRILCILTLVLALLCLPVSVLAADVLPVTELRIHYYRYTEDYSDGWNMWIWPKAAEGQRYDFDQNESGLIKDDFGVIGTVDLSVSKYTGISQIGILIRRGEWASRDVAFDRYITIPATAEGGIVNAYFVEADERIGYFLGDPNGPDKSDKFRSAFFTSETRISFKVTTELPASDIKLFADEVEVPATVSLTGTSGTVTLNQNVDFGKKYQLQANYPAGLKTYDVTYDGIYDSAAFEDAFGYAGNDLGSIVDGNHTSFRLWAPISSKVVLNIYDTGTPAIYGGTDTPVSTIDMVKDVKGTWKYETDENLHGKYYTYSVTNGTRTAETVDPYAKSTGVNGLRGMVVDFSQINPDGFTYNTRPDNITNPTDAIIYELHVRDLTSHSSWNGPAAYRGKFLGLTAEGTTYQGATTGLDHIKELGVTHVQLLPIFDFGVVDETKLNDSRYQKFNWGYMPLNYNTPEGSYSTDPYDGAKRVTELKQVTDTLTKNNIGLIMDVVYNHTGLSADSNFSLIVPGYYYRLNSDGTFSNGSGTGNETASERYMMRKFMVDSTAFWAKEYNISGFRFDLMALHDTETMNEIVDSLKAIDEDILVFGEPWNGGTTVLDADIAADKVNLKDMPDVAAFNDDFRDGIKGSVFTAAEGGFVQGANNATIHNRIRYGVVGGSNYPGLGLDGISYNTIWTTSPSKSINYVSAHDNNTLYDKLMLSTTFNQKQYVDEMQKQANAIVLTSQGIPFLHAGVEMMRSKPVIGGGFDGNSYQSPDSVNQIRWDKKVLATNKSVFDYYKGMIALRKAHPAFRMATSTEVLENVDFLYEDKPNVLAYMISNNANNDSWQKIIVIHNSGLFAQLPLPEGEWKLVANGTTVGETVIGSFKDGGNITVLEHETVILYQGETTPDDGNDGSAKGCNSGTVLFSDKVYLSASLFVMGLAYVVLRKKH